MRRGPLAGTYPASAALVALSLIPFLALVAAVFPLATHIEHSLHLTAKAFDITIAMSTGAYAFGTVLAAQLAMHLPQRRLLIAYETLFVVASILAASASTGAVFVGAFVVQGLCTSLLLIAAVPPLVTGWPAGKMPTTGAIMNLCVFGAVAAGPTLGAWQQAAGGWRPLFWAVAAVTVLALAFSVLTFEDQPGQDRSAPWDVPAVGLALVGCGAAFYGAGDLQADRRPDATSLTLLITGVALIIVLVVSEHQRKRPLVPVRDMASTIPVTGLILALTASAAAFGLMELVLTGLSTTTPPSTVALLFLPELGAAVATAALFGALFRTRFTPPMAMIGLAVLAGGAAVLAGVASRDTPVVAAGTGMIGLGVGASVSPALFMVGFSLHSKQLQRAFALIELLRGVTAFLVAPILVFLAGVISTSMASGIEGAIWICLGIAAAGAVASLAVFSTRQRRLQTPDLGRWQQDDETAWRSEPLRNLREESPPPARARTPVGSER